MPAGITTSMRDFAVDRFHGIVCAGYHSGKIPTTVGCAAYYGPHDAAFGAAFGTNRDDVDQNAVAVHRVADGVGRDERYRQPDAT
jgi:hypothetical protein